MQIIQFLVLVLLSYLLVPARVRIEAAPARGKSINMLTRQWGFNHGHSVSLWKLRSARCWMPRGPLHAWPTENRVLPSPAECIAMASPSIQRVVGGGIQTSMTAVTFPTSATGLQPKLLQRLQSEFSLTCNFNKGHPRLKHLPRQQLWQRSISCNSS